MNQSKYETIQMDEVVNEHLKWIDNPCYIGLVMVDSDLVLSNVIDAFSREIRGDFSISNGRIEMHNGARILFRKIGNIMHIAGVQAAMITVVNINPIDERELAYIKSRNRSTIKEFYPYLKITGSVNGSVKHETNERQEK